MHKLIFIIFLCFIVLKSFTQDLLSLRKLRQQKEYLLTAHNFDTITGGFYEKDENNQKIMIDKNKVYRIACAGYYWYKKFPFTAADFPNLQSLRINLQSLYPQTVWPTDLNKFSNLQILSIDYGKPTGEFSTTSEMYISKQIWSLSNLKELTLDMPFAIIGEDIIKLKKLKRLATSSYIAPELVSKLPISLFIVLDDYTVSNHDLKKYKNLKYWFYNKKTVKNVLAFPAIWLNQKSFTGLNYDAKKYYKSNCFNEKTKNKNEYHAYYNKNNQHAISGFYNNFQMDSLWQFYDEEGRVMSYYMFRNNKLIEAGFTNPFFRTIYEDSISQKQIPNFTLRIYYYSDSTCTTKSYDEGKYGKLYFVKNYTYGLEDGIQTEYKEKESIQSNYTHGVQNGKEITKDLKGNITRITEYKNGEFIKELCRNKECENFNNK